MEWSPATSIQELHIRYEQFYTAILLLIEAAIKEHGRFLILDVHSYNHRRENSFTEAPNETYPEINLGTAYNKDKWQPLCNRYNEFLSASKVLGKQPDVRQNIIFKGAHLLSG
ncbi:N-formylglutamate amidohydrolase [Niabella hibiscisoli]|uniref:N-formylglutamate amidohydrolase n=1 Tax=Niabella hibiscisoli TaxID=1825928 RepID=UPI001F0FC8A2|nr:N-formylglutamate amidohydrolase [Niabella hibiscisoli]MCH5717489.1 N-formylglutamate amidohydrolase [Niabella hibiscisoli]